jgi:BASS family bile acid:Na+ symporter
LAYLDFFPLIGECPSYTEPPAILSSGEIPMQPSLITEILFPVSTLVIMFGLGLSLTLAEFRRLARTPTAVIVGMVNQLLLLPLIAFGLGLLLAPRPELAVGLIILAAAPGGIVSNILVHVAHGDTALSITLTTLSSTVTFLSAPIWIGLALHVFLNDVAVVQLPTGALMAQIALLTVLPVLLGMTVHDRLPLLAARLRRPFHRLSTVVLVTIVAAAVISERANLTTYLTQAGVLAVLLNGLGLGAGWVSARAFGLPRPQGIAITLETGIQNAPVALTIAITLLGNTAMSIPAATYAIIMLGTASLLVFLLRQKTAWFTFERKCFTKSEDSGRKTVQ